MRRFLSASVATAALLSVAPATAAHAAPAVRAAAPAPTAVTGVSVASATDGRLTVAGKLTSSGRTVGEGRQIIVETADDQGKNWRRLHLFKGEKWPVTKADGSFGATFKSIYYPHGYYRFRFLGGPKYAASVSATVRDHRVNARVFGWKVTPTKIRKGSYVTFSGTLKEKPGATYRPFKGQVVSIEGIVKGAKTWYWYKRPKTDAKGNFKVRFRVYKDTYFIYAYYGDKKHLVDYPVKTTLVDVR
ncbi:hypothetical protein [Actinomadura hibisca]|uniref:hypothetical protein n=1 Tax=Actinomadura hibisca TaxID=68565 RepID=UPI00082A8E77|nr:hypothetical protein [Actinomadura hibisca]